MSLNVRLAVVAAACCAVPVLAAERVWDGGGGGLNNIALWDSAGNWVGDVVPAAVDDVHFAIGSFASGTRVNSAGSRTVNKLVFYATQNFSLENFGGSGDTITLTSGDLTRSNSAGGTHTITSNLAFMNTGDWFVGGAGGLVITGRVDSTNLAGLYKTGNATLTFSNNLTIDGTLTAAGGTTEINNGVIAQVKSGQNPYHQLTDNNGILLVKAGAKLNTRGFSTIPGGGTVQLSDENTRWANSPAVTQYDHISVGTSSSGSLIVENRAAITSPATDLRVGENGGVGTMTIRSGGTVRTDESVIGQQADAQGVVTVSGAGSKWTATTMILGGYAGLLGRSAELTITDGASAVAVDSTTLTIDAATLTVNGGTFTTPSLNTLANVNARVALSDPSNGPALTVSNGDYSGSIADAAGGAGSLTKVSTGTLTLRGPVSYTGTTRVEAGTLVLNGGVDNRGGSILVSSNATLSARGFVNRPVSGAGTVTASDTLLIGDLARTDGFSLAGSLNVGGFAATLLDADRATVLGTITLNSGGRLSSFAGIEANGTLNATGSASVFNNFTNGGVVNGPTATGQMLTFSGIVNGSGSYTGRVTFAGGFSPGNSPAAVSLGTTVFDPANVLTMELAGTTAGSEYDRLSAQSLTLDGALNVVLLNGFSPSLGDSFTLINGPMIGTFDTVNLPALAGGLGWQVVTSSSAYAIAVVPEPASLTIVFVAAGLLRRQKR